MWHFLAKLGKKDWTKSVVHCVAVTSFAGYMGVHIAGHDLIRSLLTAQKPGGGREEISDNLQAIIVSVYQDIKDNFNQKIVNSPWWKQKPPELKWFISSTLEPITFGLSDSEPGILVGLPNFFNYETESDLQDHVYELRSIKLFKTSKESNVEIPDDELDLDRLQSVKLLDKFSDDGKNYRESLILSENAKKFAIARQLLYADTYRPFFIGLAMSGSMILSLFVSRAIVAKCSLANRHVTQRLLVHLLAGSLGLGHFQIFSELLNEYYSDQADERAIKVNDSYREGAIEYFTKTIQRNKALRNMVDDIKNVYDEEGNHVDALFPIIRKRHVKFTERLNKAQGLSEQQVD